MDSRLRDAVRALLAQLPAEPNTYPAAYPKNQPRAYLRRLTAKVVDDLRAALDEPAESDRYGLPVGTLPDCMMPDGGPPCRGYMDLQARARAEEREACAVIAEREPAQWESKADEINERIATAIRARGSDEL